jgi:ribosomal protein L18E
MEQENIMQDMMTMWEDAVDKDTNKLAIDFKAKVAEKITGAVGRTPNATPNAPKLVNNSVIDAAKEDPATAVKALNLDKKTMKKMKKENVFPTLLQWRESKK